MTHKINHANIKEWARDYDGEPFDAILCDPPYELGFMGKSWDSSGIAFDTEMWSDLFRHIKPGGHLLAFSGSRTYHRMAVAIEDAGFEIRDMIEWVYGSGFPKSLNIGKAVDKLSGRTGENDIEFVKWLKANQNKSLVEIDNALGTKSQAFHYFAESDSNRQIPTNEHYKTIKDLMNLGDDYDEFITKKNRELKDIREVEGYENGIKTWDKKYQKPILNKPVSEEAKLWNGYGTALKPAHEPCVLARKPLDKGMTVAGNVLKHGTGGLNIDGTRVGIEKIQVNRHSGYNSNSLVESTKGKWKGESEQFTGRFPANLIHDGSDEVEAVFPQTKSGTGAIRKNADGMFGLGGDGVANVEYGDKGSASRFFYTAKASKRERNAGLEGFEDQITNDGRKTDIDNAFQRGITERKNHHPTVKPLSLTKYLATLIKPPTGGRLLVPFSGSGSEMIGALQAGWEYVEGVELTEEYIPIAEARIKYWLEKKEPEQSKLL